MPGISEFLDGEMRYGDQACDDPHQVASSIRAALDRDPNRALTVSPRAARQLAAWLDARVSVKWCERFGGPVERICRAEELAPVIKDMLRLDGGVEPGSVRVENCE